jgi:hypothetical protein
MAPETAAYLMARGYIVPGTVFQAARIASCTADGNGM